MAKVIANECLGCPWATFTAEPGATEVKVACDPPMGECPGEFPPGYDANNEEYATKYGGKNE